MNKIKLFAIGILLIVFISTSGCISFVNNTDGIATDKIARISHGGWIWKTWRVELLNDHPVGGEYGAIPQRYGVGNNPELIKQLSDYAESGQRAKLYYHGNFFVFDWEYSDAEVIYKVEIAKEA
jgi:hypothetical protein